MTDEKRQKVMLGFLAVAAIAAGSYFFFIRDSGATQVAKKGPPPPKKVRKVPINQKKTRKTRAKVKKRDQSVTHKVRERPDAGPKIKKGRRRGSKKTKKKKLSPAA